MPQPHTRLGAHAPELLRGSIAQQVVSLKQAASTCAGCWNGLCQLCPPLIAAKARNLVAYLIPPGVLPGLFPLAAPD
eukprot:4379670-Pleurochrysis_carterae.AAC.2